MNYIKIRLKFLAILSFFSSLASASTSLMIEGCAMATPSIESFTPAQLLEQDLQNGTLTIRYDYAGLKVNLLDQDGDIAETTDLKEVSKKEEVDGDKIHVTSLFTYQLGEETKEVLREETYELKTETSNIKCPSVCQTMIFRDTYYVTKEDGKVHILSQQTKKLPAVFKTLSSVEKVSYLSISRARINGTFVFSDGEEFEGSQELPYTFKTIGWQRIGDTINFEEQKGAVALYGEQEIDLRDFISNAGETREATIKTAEKFFGEENGKRKFKTEYEKPDGESFWVYRFDEIPVINKPAINPDLKPEKRHVHHGPSNEFERFGRFIGNDCSIM
ncbi:MAG: hypothetical protein CNLJKLNK_01279 [Holosporales bacterium]